MKQKKITLLERLLGEGWFDSESEAAPWVMMRSVLADNVPVVSLSAKISPEAEIRVKEYYKRRYVNKGGLKLEGALRDFGVSAAGRVALDCGASTGGFTDCLLQSGASRVYAVDAGHGQLAGKLMQDDRVVNAENTNLADSSLTALDPKPSLITLDLSYLSLTDALPLCRGIAGEKHEIICLVKPNFEAELVGGRSSGVISDPQTLTAVLERLTDEFTRLGYAVKGITNSPVTGSGGAYEFFMYLASSGEKMDGTEGAISEAVKRALELPRFDYGSAK